MISGVTSGGVPSAGGDAGAGPQRSLLRELVDGVRAPLLGGILAGAGTMAVAALVPWWIGRAIDDLTRDDATTGSIGWRSAVLALLVVVAALLTLVQERCDTRTRVLSSLEAMTRVHHQAVRLAGSSRRSSAGEVINLGLGDIRPIGAGIAALSRGAGGLVAVVVVGLVLLSASWMLCVLVLVGVVVLLRINDRLLAPYRTTAQDVRERMGELTGVALDASSGLRVIKGLGAAAHFSQRYRASSRRVLDAATTMARAEGAVAGNRALAAGLLGTATVWLGAYLVQQGSLTVGDLVAAYGYAVFLATPMRWLLTTHQQWAGAKVSADRVAAYLATDPGRPDHTEPTERSGAVGDPEAGWEALPGAYTVVASAQSLDWSAVADRLEVPRADPARVRVIRADDYLFSGALSEVLDPTGTAPAGLDDAAHAAALTDLVQALPGGLAHPVAAGGSDLSGGEQQRVRLARALVANPETLVLVDPTTALDSTTEVEVAQRLRARRTGATTVVLTNSAPHLVEADRVVFLDGQRVAATGTHSELLARADYRAMVERGEAE